MIKTDRKRKCESNQREQHPNRKKGRMSDCQSKREAPKKKGKRCVVKAPRQR